MLNRNSMEKIRNLIIVLVFLVAAGFIFFEYVPLNINTSVLTALTQNSEDVPEMKDILDPTDQEKRLLAARKLVERVDVEEALEILEHSALPHTGEGHLVVHQIGFYA
ncbi:hypothetical protein HYS92_00090 [Candidatus Daviesbacteria bacterium]|nr:hypothetical protein [Candidatus Daviesbacteria bacterium]